MSIIQSILSYLPVWEKQFAIFDQNLNYSTRPLNIFRRAWRQCGGYSSTHLKTVGALAFRSLFIQSTASLEQKYALATKANQRGLLPSKIELARFKFENEDVTISGGPEFLEEVTQYGLHCTFQNNPFAFVILKSMEGKFQFKVEGAISNSLVAWLAKTILNQSNIDALYYRFDEYTRGSFKAEHAKEHGFRVITETLFKLLKKPADGSSLDLTFNHILKYILPMRGFSIPDND